MNENVFHFLPNKVFFVEFILLTTEIRCCEIKKNVKLHKWLHMTFDSVSSVNNVVLCQQFGTVFQSILN